MRISAINTYSAINRQNNSNNKNIQKSNNQNISSKPSFSGYTENPIIPNEYGYISCYILGQDLKPYFMGIENRVDINNDSEEKIADYLARNIKTYTENFDKNRTFEKTPNKNNTKLYIADPNEAISDEIRANHGYIVYDNEPAFPTLEQLKGKYTSSKPDPHDFFHDLRDYITYQQRVISADEDSIENPVDRNTPEQENKYRERIDKSQQKVDYAQNLFNIMYKTGEDFMYKDFLANKLATLKYKYNVADRRLKDIEFHKYLTDEGIEHNQAFLDNYYESGADYLSYNQRMGMQCSINSLKRSSEELQKEYDEYTEIKNNGPKMIEETQNELNRVLDKMSKNFEEVKAYYENNHLENI